MRRLLLLPLVVLPACTHPSSSASTLPVVAPAPSPASTSSAPPAVASTAPGAIVDPTFLEQWTATGRFSHGTPSSIRLTPAGDQVLFLRSGPRTPVRDLYAVDVATGAERVLLTADAILHGAAEVLSPEERARRERTRTSGRGINSFTLSPDGAQILVPLSGHLYRVERATGAVHEIASHAHGPAIDPRFSPDGHSLAAVHDGDLYVTDLATGRERRLTQGANAQLTHGVAEFVAQEEMDRFEGFWWSPDGHAIAYEEADTRAVERLHVMDPSHPERDPEANPYPRTGRTNATVRLGIVPVAGGRTTWVEWDHARDPYLARVTWPAHAPLTLVVQNRAQTEAVVLTADEHGATHALWTETDPAWVNLDPDLPRWLADGSGFLWSTERDGHAQLELRDAHGARVRAVTPPELEFQHLIHVDETAATAYVIGAPDPNSPQLFRVPLDPAHGAPTALSTGPGEDDAVFADHAAVRVHIHAPPDAARSWTLEQADGTRVAELRSLAEEPHMVPRVEWVTIGPRAFHAALVRPRNFDPARRYPVIDYVYGGPHSRMVTTVRNRLLFPQWMADHGYVVVCIDGRGTPGRGREWERALRGQLGEVPLHDQVEGLQALGERFHELDLTRVGIYGWSFGGYLSGLAAELRPDVFHAAVAGAPVTDWRDYDTHYTERYLGLPDEHRDDYDRASLLTHARDLRRPLLLIHGTADDNVYFLHTLRLTDALFRAGRPFEFLPLIGFTHMVPEPEAATRLNERIMAFFDHALVERTP